MCSHFCLFSFHSLGYLFTTDSNLLRIFNECHHPIDQLTFSLDTCVIPSEMSVYAEREKLILTSIINQNCSVGISTDVPVQLIDIQERNRKKLAKLQEHLTQLNERMSSEKYRKKTKPHRKKIDLDQVCVLVYHYAWRRTYRRCSHYLLLFWEFNPLSTNAVSRRSFFGISATPPKSKTNSSSIHF